MEDEAPISQCTALPPPTPTVDHAYPRCLVLRGSSTHGEEERVLRHLRVVQRNPLINPPSPCCAAARRSPKRALARGDRQSHWMQINVQHSRRTTTPVSRRISLVIGPLPPQSSSWCNSKIGSPRPLWSQFVCGDMDFPQHIEKTSRRAGFEVGRNKSRASWGAMFHK